MTSPTISVITVCYNAADTVLPAIQSVLQQDYGKVEYIMIDGGSTDGSQNIIQPFAKELAYFVSEPDKGLYHALNKGLAKATGDIVAILHADDFYAHNRVLSRVAAGFRKFKVDALYMDLQYVNRKNPTKVVRQWRSGKFSRRKFLHGWMPPHPSLFIKKEVYDTYGYFNTLFRSAADYEFIIRTLFKNKIQTVYVPGVAVKMRIGGMSNKSLKNRFHANKEDQKAWSINGLICPPHISFAKPLRKFPQYLPAAIPLYGAKKFKYNLNN